MTTVEQIIADDNREFERISKMQDAYIKKLKKMERDMKAGKDVDTSKILARWQAAGILDENGDFTEQYKGLNG